MYASVEVWEEFLLNEVVLFSICKDDRNRSTILQKIIKKYCAVCILNCILKSNLTFCKGGHSVIKFV